MKASFKLCTGILLLSAPARAAVINVPTDFPTIQQAVAAAGFSDTILVAPGVYQENVKVVGKSITLASHYLLDGNPAHILNTVIDGSAPSHPDTGSVIILENSAQAVVAGLTLTGGTGTRWLDQSDGLYYREGGGILTEGGSPTIRDNVIIGNRATDDATSTSAGGGGLRSGFGNVTVAHNVFAFNEGLYGGGMVIFRNTSEVYNNIVYQNSGGHDFGGAGIWAASSAGGHVMFNNTVIGNRCDLDGGGILVWNNPATLVNNVVRGNQAATLGPQIRLRSGTAGTTVDYSDVEGGFAGTGNIDLDPLWASPEFNLTSLSPCVDAGDPSLPLNDVEDGGQPGMALPPSLGTVHGDLGAYGGPYARPFPVFNSPLGYLSDDTLDYGTVAVGSFAVGWEGVGKSQFGIVRVDSVRFANGSSLSVESAIPVLVGPVGTGVLDSISVKWSPSTYGPLAATLQVYHSDISAASPLLAHIKGLAPGKTGDTNFDGVITSADIIHLVNYVFKGGTPPQPVPRSGDIDCSGAITSADIINLVNYVFKGGTAPCA
jgi:hypothetical protein